MRNFFKNTFGRITKVTSQRQLVEILDTDEDKIISQYKGYLNYINKVKKNLLQKSEDFMRFNRQLHPR